MSEPMGCDHVRECDECYNEVERLRANLEVMWGERDRALDENTRLEARLREMTNVLESASVRLDQLGWSLETTTPRDTLAELAHSERDAVRAALAAAQPEGQVEAKGKAKC